MDHIWTALRRLQLFLTVVFIASLILTSMWGSLLSSTEVFYNYSWGYICQDGWDLQDAAVVCRAIGYGMVEYWFGMGQPLKPLPVWLSDLQCNGDEWSVTECQNNGWREHDGCTNNIAGVKCRERSKWRQCFTPKLFLKNATRTVLSTHTSLCHNDFSSFCSSVRSALSMEKWDSCHFVMSEI